MRKYLLSIAVFVLAFGIFSVSALRSASIDKVFAAAVPTVKPLVQPTPFVDYTIVFPGKILPDSPIWTLKATRDWFLYSVTMDPLKKAELALLFSDKRLIASKLLLEAKKPDLAVSTFTKGEKYLEIATKQEEVARQKGMNTTEFVKKLALASLKHRQVTEEEILPMAPEDAKPEIIKMQIYAKTTYRLSKEILISKGIEVPKDPFNGQ